MQRVWTMVTRIPFWIVQVLIRGYQFIISPLLLGTCKFVPSCSDYFLQAVREWGVLRGSWLGLRRIARCHPFGMGGLDPVPPRSEHRDTP